MTIDGKLFPGQENEEKVFLLIRKHWFNYVMFVALALLMIAPVIFFVIYANIINPEFFSTDTVFVGSVLLVSAYLLVIIALQLYGIVDFYLDVYIVTDKRIVDISQNGFFKRQISELHLQQVQDVNAQVDGFFKTLLHFGDVYIQTAGERANFVFQSIPHPYTVAKEIINLHEDNLHGSGGSTAGSSTGASGSEGLADKGLPLNVLESRAKDLMNGLDKPKDQPQPYKGISFSGSKISSTNDDGRGDAEGVLKEGREVDLQ